MNPRPALGLISHGTSSAQGQGLIEALAARVSADLRARGLVAEVMLGHVDVQQPDVAEVLRALPPESPTVLVPLLLSPGYHVHVDLAEAVAAAGGANGTNGTATRDIRLTPTLGPDRRLARVLAARLPALTDDDHIVLAAAGSSDERANAACREMGEHLSVELGRPVDVGFHAGGGASLGCIVEQKRTLGGRVVLSSYLLAPGFFQDLAQKLVTGTSDVLTEPLLTPTDDTKSLFASNGEAMNEAPQGLIDVVRERMISVL